MANCGVKPREKEKMNLVLERKLLHPVEILVILRGNRDYHHWD